MKKITLLALLMLTGSALFAQLGIFPYGSRGFSYEGKTLIAIVDPYEEDHPENFQEAVTNALTTNWHLTPFKVITVDEWKSNKAAYPENGTNLYLTFNILQVKNCNDAGLAGKNLVGVEYLLGNNVKINGQVNRLMGTIVYNISTPEELPFQACLQKDIMLLQAFIKTQGTNISEYKVPNPIIKERTLYVNKEQLGAKITVERLQKKYPYKIKLVDKEEYGKALLAKDSDAVFFDYIRTHDEQVFVLVYSMVDESILWHSKAAMGSTNSIMGNNVDGNIEYLGNRLSK